MTEELADHPDLQHSMLKITQEERDRALVQINKALPFHIEVSYDPRHSKPGLQVRYKLMPAQAAEVMAQQYDLPF